MVEGKVEGVVGKVEGVVDVEVDCVVEGEAVVVVLGRLSESMDRRVWNEKQVPYMLLSKSRGSLAHKSWPNGCMA